MAAQQGARGVQQKQEVDIWNAERVACGMTFYACYAGNQQEALRLIERARQIASKSGTPVTRGWLAAVDAEIQSRVGDVYGSLRALDDAATTLQTIDAKDLAQPNRKAQWISAVRTLFKRPGWEGFKGVLYYKSSKHPSCRWFVDSSQASLTAFSGIANDVYYYTRDEL
jgi:hypothetical protein